VYTRFQRACVLDRGTSLVRNRPPLRPYSSSVPRALCWSCGVGHFRMCEIPLYSRKHARKCHQETMNCHLRHQIPPEPNTSGVKYWIASRQVLERLAPGNARRDVQGAGFRVQGSGCRIQGAGCRVQGAGCRVQGAGFRVQGLKSPKGHSTRDARGEPSHQQRKHMANARAR